MSLVTVADLRAHLNLDSENDDALLADKIAAATGWVSSYCGVADFTDAEAFPDGAPELVKEAVRRLAAQFYEDREGMGAEGIASTSGVTSLLAPYRRWCFG